MTLSLPSLFLQLIQRQKSLSIGANRREIGAAAQSTYMSRYTPYE
jgi:hypothetical protein